MAMTSQIGHWIGAAERLGPKRFEVYEPATAEQYAEACDGGELQTGRVWVNTGHSIPPDITLPPWKMSGLGPEGGMEGLVSFTRAKTVSLNAGAGVPGFWNAPGT